MGIGKIEFKIQMHKQSDQTMIADKNRRLSFS